MFIRVLEGCAGKVQGMPLFELLLDRSRRRVPGRTWAAGERLRSHRFDGRGGCAPCCVGAPPLLHQWSHNCITASQRRSAFAFEFNVCQLVNRWGLGRCFEFTVTTPDNCRDVKEFQRRWHSFYTNVVWCLFVGGCGVRERQQRGAWHVHNVVVMPFEMTAPRKRSSEWMLQAR